MAWLIERIGEAARRWPDEPAVICGSESLTRRELWVRAESLAAALEAHGVEPGSRVGLLAARGIGQVTGMLGVLRAGAAYVPLDPGNPRARLERILAGAEARLVVDACVGASEALPGSVPLAELVARGCGASPPDPARFPADELGLVYVIHTSGSTGVPKGAGVFHAGFRNLLEWYAGETGFSENDAALVITPPTFDLTQKNYFLPLLTGGRLVIDTSPHYDIGRITSLIERHRITLLNCTPSAFYPVVEDAPTGRLQQLESLRHVVLGGESIATPRLRRWLLGECCGAAVLNTYGPTECTDIALFYRMDKTNHHLHESAPAGAPLPGVHVAIVNESLEKVLPGQPGELVIGGAGVGAGYIGDPEKTAACFPPNPFPNWCGGRIYRTGDRARQLPNGMIEFLGRADLQVKVRGFRVELGEIESALRSHPSVADAVVVAVGTSGAGTLAACVTMRPGVEAPAPELLRRHAATLLPDYMVPSSIRFAATLPWTPHGKIDRRKLASEAEADGGAPQRAISPPGTAMERLVLDLWQDVIGRRDFGVTDAFLEVGGTSLHIATIHMRLQDVLDRRFPITRLLGHPTVRDLAASLEAEPRQDTSKPHGTSERKDGGALDAAERARLQRAALARTKR